MNVLVKQMKIDEYRKLKGKPKYSNEKTVVEGIKFDSKKEANRYSELRLLEAHGAIQSLEVQPKFQLVVNGQRIGAYVGDFKYIEEGETVIEDAKGFKTRVYGLKKRLMKALFGIEIKEV